MSLQQPVTASPAPPPETASENAPRQGLGKTPSAGKQATPAGKEGAARALGRSEPVELRIPAIDMHTTQLVPLGIQPGGKIEVPEENDTVGWYKKGPTPGQFGPAVMGGHVDSDAGPAVFYSLGELRPGDQVTVRRADGTTVVFTVYAVEQYPKNDFPTQKVYAPANNRAELRLITCGGTFNDDTQHYRSNIVVYAKLTSTSRT